MEMFWTKLGRSDANKSVKGQGRAGFALPIVFLAYFGAKFLLFQRAAGVFLKYVGCRCSQERLSSNLRVLNVTIHELLPARKTKQWSPRWRQLRISLSNVYSAGIYIFSKRPMYQNNWKQFLDVLSFKMSNLFQFTTPKSRQKVKQNCLSHLTHPSLSSRHLSR